MTPPFRLFQLRVGLENEWGYFALSELLAARGPSVLAGPTGFFSMKATFDLLIISRFPGKKIGARYQLAGFRSTRNIRRRNKSLS